MAAPVRHEGPDLRRLKKIMVLIAKLSKLLSKSMTRGDKSQKRKKMDKRQSPRDLVMDVMKRKRAPYIWRGADKSRGEGKLDGRCDRNSQGKGVTGVEGCYFQSIRILKIPGGKKRNRKGVLGKTQKAHVYGGTATLPAKARKLQKSFQSSPRRIINAMIKTSDTEGEWGKVKKGRPQAGTPESKRSKEAHKAPAPNNPRNHVEN